MNMIQKVVEEVREIEKVRKDNTGIEKKRKN